MPNITVFCHQLDRKHVVDKPSDRSWLTLGDLEKPKHFLFRTDIALNGDSLTTGGRDVTNRPFRSVAAS
jgi:hypothetical protein